MVKKTFAILLSLVLLYSCNNKEEHKPATALDTGRSFIRASLDGNFEAAEQVLLKDTQNQQLFDSYKMYYERLSAEKKKNYKAASYESSTSRYLFIS